MSEVAITFNHRTYRFACDEGEEERLRAIAAYLKTKLDALSAEHGQVGDERLVLMAALIIADELFDARADVDSLLDSETEKLKSVSADDSDDDEDEVLAGRRGGDSF